KRVTIISILIQNRNQKCSGTQALLSICLYAKRTPSKVIDALAHAGICFSYSSILNMIGSLSQDHTRQLKRLKGDGKLSRVMLAYDNFDVNISTSQPTIQR
ncbi:uncharacterized protein EI90DRAFT_2898092, partial [Cantharellus anzutake]|uniref:uncharacterized protein n=1 Tax=Cantharellus anzutake TaxID=1750568 RepID=UPI001905DA49